MSYIINLYAKEISTKDGKKFTAFETRDKSGNRVNIAFAQKGDPAPALSDCPCQIEVIDGRKDKRKFFATVRIYKYNRIGEIEKPSGDDLSDLFNS